MVAAVNYESSNTEESFISFDEGYLISELLKKDITSCNIFLDSI